MTLAALVPQLLFWGFIGAYFTHSLWFSLGVSAIVWWLIGTIAFHRNDQVQQIDTVATALSSVLEKGAKIEAVIMPLQQIFNSTAELIVALNFTTPLSILFGVALGLSVVWAFQLPPLLNVEMWHLVRASDDTNVWLFHFGVARFILGCIIAVVASFFFLGHFQTVLSPNVAMAFGIVAFLAALALIIYSLIQWLRSGQLSKRLDLGYSFALLGFALLPFLYTLFERWRPLQGWLFNIGFIILICITIFLSIRFYGTITPEAQPTLAGDVRYTPQEARPWRQIARWFALYVPLVLIYLVAWIRDEMTQTPVFPGSEETAGNTVQVFFAVALTSLLINVAVCACGFWRWRKADNVGLWIDDSDVVVDEPLPITPATKQSEARQKPEPVQDNAPAAPYKLMAKKNSKKQG